MIRGENLVLSATSNIYFKCKNSSNHLLACYDSETSCNVEEHVIVCCLEHILCTSHT